jgi:hypothetical protein
MLPTRRSSILIDKPNTLTNPDDMALPPILLWTCCRIAPAAPYPEMLLGSQQLAAKPLSNGLP